MSDNSQDTATKLRAEIQGAKGYRHDFVLRKFAFGAALLGAGSLSVKTASGVVIDFTSLLYLVPLVAISFDLYIITEDYRIKRAGEFIRREHSGALGTERKWEDFAHKYPNPGSTIAFALVTLLFLLGAATILYQTKPHMLMFSAWVLLVTAIEGVFIKVSLYLRAHLEQ